MKQNWWLHGRSRPALRHALNGLKRCIVTPEVAKHRVFVWMSTDVVPDHTCHVLPATMITVLGLCNAAFTSCGHLRRCSWMGVGNDPRYTSAPTFETFPFPWPPIARAERLTARRAIAEAARELVEKRDAWLNPPGASQEELENPHAYQSLQCPPFMAGGSASQIGRSRVCGLWLARYALRMPRC